MSDAPKPALRPGQFRVAAAGFAIPVVCAGWGVGVPLHAMISPSLHLFAYVISLPPLALIAWMQFQLWRAGELPGGPARRAKLAHARRLLLLPFILIAAGLLLSAGMLWSGVPQPPGPVPLHALVMASLVISMIGAGFLPLAGRARSYFPTS